MLPQDVLPIHAQRTSYPLQAIQAHVGGQLIGDDARVGAGSGVIKDVPAGQTVWWFPARPIKRVKEELAALAFVPRVVKQLTRPQGKRARRQTRSK